MARPLRRNAQAREAAMKALDWTIPSPGPCRAGAIAVDERDFSGAIRSLQRAVELNPDRRARTPASKPLLLLRAPPGGAGGDAESRSASTHCRCDPHVCRRRLLHARDYERSSSTTGRRSSWIPARWRAHDLAPRSKCSAASRSPASIRGGSPDERRRAGRHSASHTSRPAAGTRLPRGISSRS